MLKSVLLSFALLCCSVAHADEASLKAKLQKSHPQIGAVTQVNKSGILGLYEVVTDNKDLYYTDEAGSYLIAGNIYELKSMRNLTEERSRVLFALDFDKLPLDLAVKRVKGNGQRRMAYFADPNCGFCKKLETELKSVDNVTLYRFMLPIFNGSEEKIRNILCSADPNKSWENLMLNGVQPPAGNCPTPQTEKVRALAEKLKVNGTPALIFSSGVLQVGYLPAAELEKALSAPLVR